MYRCCFTTKASRHPYRLRCPRGAMQLLRHIAVPAEPRKSKYLKQNNIVCFYGHNPRRKEMDMHWNRRLLTIVLVAFLASCNIPSYEQVWVPLSGSNDSDVTGVLAVCQSRAALQATNASNNARATLGAGANRELPSTPVEALLQRSQAQEVDRQAVNAYNTTYSATLNNCMAESGFVLRQYCVTNCQ